MTTGHRCARAVRWVRSDGGFGCPECEKPPNDAPTERGLDLKLDAFTYPETTMMLFVVDTLLRGEIVRSLGGDEPVLETIALKLRAHIGGKAQPTEGA